MDGVGDVVDGVGDAVDQIPTSPSDWIPDPADVIPSDIADSVLSNSCNTDDKKADFEDGGWSAAYLERLWDTKGR